MKVLYIAAALLEQSDEDHPMTAADLISYLAANGIWLCRHVIPSLYLTRLQDAPVFNTNTNEREEQ